MSLMQQMVRLVEDHARQNNITRINKIRLVVGKLTSALPAALEFGFSVLKQGDPLLESAELEIEERDIQARCSKCQHVYEVTEYRFSCPECGSGEADVVAGKELYVDYFDGE